MLSENIKELRRQKGISQEQLAAKLHVVRQTVSKWEKGLSVPDAQMLCSIADFFEVPVSELLGEKIEKEEDTNEVAIQLALLNEQLAERSRRTRKIVKGIIIGIISLFLAAVILFMTAVFLRVQYKKSVSEDTWTTASFVCTLDGKEYYYEIEYDNQYQIHTGGGDAWISNHVFGGRSFDDANVFKAQLEDYFKLHGGTVKMTGGEDLIE